MPKLPSLTDILSFFFGKKLGTALTTFIAVFALGVAVAYVLPNWLVTANKLSAEVLKLEGAHLRMISAQQKVDVKQSLALVAIRLELAEKQLYDLEDKLDENGGVLTPKQQIRMERVLRKIEKISEEEKELRRDLR